MSAENLLAAQNAELREKVRQLEASIDSLREAYERLYLRYVAATRGTTEADFSASLEHQLATKLAEAQLQVRRLEADLAEVKRLRNLSLHPNTSNFEAADAFLARLDARNVTPAAQTCKRCGGPKRDFQVYCGAACSVLAESGK